VSAPRRGPPRAAAGRRGCSRVQTAGSAPPAHPAPPRPRSDGQGERHQGPEEGRRDGRCAGRVAAVHSPPPIAPPPPAADPPLRPSPPAADKKKATGKREHADKPAAKQPKKARGAEAEAAAAGPAVGSGRQAAQNLTFRDADAAGRGGAKADRVEVKEEARAADEAAALAETAAGTAHVTARRLGDFSVVGADGRAEPLEALAYASKPLFLTGVVYPREGAADKATGRRVARLGPLKAFSVDLSGAAAAVVLATGAATYVAGRPAAAYKKHFAHLSEQADLAHEVHRALTPQHGGSAFATLEEVVARLARGRVLKGYGSAREGLLVNGRFVLAQLEAEDARLGAHGTKLGATAFAAALRAALTDFKYEGAQRGATNGGGITIARDAPGSKAAAASAAAAAKGKGKGKAGAAPAGGDAQMAADEDFARQMQAKMDAEMRGKAKKQSTGGAAAYLRVDEAEIADDYPPPTPYAKEEEETDELLLFDEEMAEADPEALPRRLLTDFSLYNADGLLAPLELLPLAAGCASCICSLICLLDFAAARVRAASRSASARLLLRFDLHSDL
jgi:hypothetical protein